LPKNDPPVLESFGADETMVGYEMPAWGEEAPTETTPEKYASLGPISDPQKSDTITV